MIDPISFTQELIQKPSVTPIEAGALDLLENVLKSLGFKTKRYKFEDVDNLYARLGTAAPNFCFAGHTDVVPVGDLAKWSTDPFAGTINNGVLMGRGAADMKSAIAAFASATEIFIKDSFKGSISFLITGDEEGVAINGTKKLLEAITSEGEIIDHCIVGEPTCPKIMGDMIKNGRRGSINCTIHVNGKQGHVAYPHRAINPIPALIEYLSIIQNHILDEGAEGFQASNLEIVTIDVGNPATNTIPQSASARANIRFNTNHSGESLKAWFESVRDKVAANFEGEITLDIVISGEPFFTPPSRFTDIIQSATQKVTGILPELSTTGGTSDARFIKNYCPVCEFGIVGATLHQIDENVQTEDIIKLRDIYLEILKQYFS